MACKRYSQIFPIRTVSNHYYWFLLIETLERWNRYKLKLPHVEPIKSLIWQWNNFNSFDSSTFMSSNCLFRYSFHFTFFTLTFLFVLPRFLAPLVWYDTKSKPLTNSTHALNFKFSIQINTNSIEQKLLGSNTSNITENVSKIAIAILSRLLQPFYNPLASDDKMLTTRKKKWRRFHQSHIWHMHSILSTEIMNTKCR